MKRIKLLIPLVIALAMMIFVVACSQPAQAPSQDKEGTKTEQKATDESKTAQADASSVDNSYVIKAAEWKDKYPNQYETYMQNLEYSLDYPGAPSSSSYLDLFPALKTIYKGSNYDIFYVDPQGHPNALETVRETLRPHKNAYCYNCKTPQYMILEQKYGDKFYKMDFEKVTPEIDEPISCYDCHTNTPGVMNVTRTNFNKAVEEFDLKVDEKTKACAQCHNDYYPSPENGEVSHPWGYGTDPDSVLKWNNENNWSDFTQPESGFKLIKVQHPEFEHLTNNSPHFLAGLSCADCHMKKEDGYTSHRWTSPFKDVDQVEQICLSCHKGMTAEQLMDAVNGIQAQTDKRFTEISENLERITKTVAQNKDSYDEAKYKEIESKYRDAQFYFDFVFAENSDGFHNPALAKDCLDKADKLIEEIDGLL